VYGITDLLTFVVGTIFIVLLPGPNSIFVLTTATRRGVRAGYWAASGVFVGDTVLMVLAATGAASVLYANPALFTALKYAGAAYLAWIGLGLLKRAWHNWFEPGKHAENVAAPLSDPLPGDKSESKNDRIPPTSISASTSISTHIRAQTTPKPNRHLTPFRSSLLVSLLNPKAIFFFISFFVQFVDPSYPYPALTFLLLGLVVQAVSLLYLTVLILGGASLAAHFQGRPRLNAVSAATVGILFVAFGLKLADATLR
jgi:leucine efflux protein